MQPVSCDSEKVAKEVLSFVADRLLIWLKDKGLRHDVVEAAVSARSHDPYGAFLSATALQEAVHRPDWLSTLQSYSRCGRITKDLESLPLQPERYKEPSVAALYTALEGVGKVGEVSELVSALESLRPRVEAFYEDVLVNDPDLLVRSARQALVQKVVSLAQGVADLSRLEGY